ncbi:bombesin receptor subtype-3 [Culex quinquefasciatus]|uniref:Bombesin receptor subtype-3 n=1 Tax=Culex quinquefasciatus TaxID=7176 RepID=B0XDZ7_CULQU|nr:bombesin receptor subtype-3 [Culex quinquefasciatus]|eukprot:XP_001867869.1 bombesin receptor subtype-3 [Culex quinquefasciatus]
MSSPGGAAQVVGNGTIPVDVDVDVVYGSVLFQGGNSYSPGGDELTLLETLLSNYSDANSGGGELMNMSSTTEVPYTPYERRPETYIVPILFAAIFIVGVLGNGTLIIVFLRHRAMRNVPNTCRSLLHAISTNNTPNKAYSGGIAGVGWTRNPKVKWNTMVLALNLKKQLKTDRHVPFHHFLGGNFPELKRVDVDESCQTRDISALSDMGNILANLFFPIISHVSYILSLALADLLLIVTTVPFTSIVYTLDSWPWGSLLCTSSEFIKDVSIGVSVFTLTALSGDRFFAIVDPLRKFHAHGGGRKATRMTIAIAVMIWVLAIVFAIPAIMGTHIRVSTTTTTRGREIDCTSEIVIFAVFVAFHRSVE